MSQAPPTNRLLELLRHKPAPQDKSDIQSATKSSTQYAKSDIQSATKVAHLPLLKITHSMSPKVTPLTNGAAFPKGRIESFAI
jgi:hypothetical protein